jgi:hypothetical protein
MVSISYFIIKPILIAMSPDTALIIIIVVVVIAAAALRVRRV